MEKRVKLTIAALTFIGVIILSFFGISFGNFMINYIININSDTNPHVWHCTIEYWNHGELISISTHPMTITNFGLNQTSKLLGDNSDLGLSWFCLSNDETEVDTDWIVLPNEITTGGLARAQAAYVITGLGTWNMSYTWTCTVAQGVCLYGVCSNSGTSSTLCLAEQQGSGARKNLDVGSELKMTVQGTVA